MTVLQYVTGFLFGDMSLEDNVLLIEKKRPAWQKGLMNGLGGKVEPGEGPVEAMRRESIEEAGVDPEWSSFCCIEYSDMILHLFAAQDGTAFRDARAQTDEELFRLRLDQLRPHEARMVPNLQWWVPLARHHLLNERVALAHVLFKGTGGGATIARKM
jgi:8-oxo-dGTP diphosphatase